MIFLGILLVGSFVWSIIFGAIGTLFLPTTFGAGWFELLGLYALQWAFALTATLFAFLMVWLLQKFAARHRQHLLFTGSLGGRLHLLPHRRRV